MTLDLTGAQLHCVLEQQFVGPAPVLYPSATVGYAVTAAGTTGTAGDCAGRRVVTRRSRSAGPPSSTAQTYRVTVNNFLAGGGDGFSALTGGRTGDRPDRPRRVHRLPRAEPTGVRPATDRITVQ